MLRSLTLRLANIAFLLFAVLILNFVLIQSADGDPVDVMAGQMGGADPEIVDRLRQIYGFDQPMHVQLGRYLSRVLVLDFGQSYYFNQPVTGIILARVPATILLITCSVLLALFVGTLLGVLSALRPNNLFSHLVTAVSLAGYAAPVFWTGILLIIWLSLNLQIFPSSGMYDVRARLTGWAYVWDVARHLVLPTLTLASTYLALYSRLARASMMEALNADFTRTARAKGASGLRVVFGHALRNAMIPLVTILGLQFSQVLAGAVMVETVFNWPGLGRLVFESILRRDYPTLLGTLFFSAVIVLVANALTDIAYRLIDPRITR